MSAELDHHNAVSNVAVFIDYENVHRTLLKQHTNLLHLAFFEKLRKWCSEHNRRVVRIVVYCNFDNNDLYESYHQSTLQNYGVETVHTSNQGKNYADLKLTIDVLTAMYLNDNIDEFFIMSNDKDMTPLLNAIRANKRNVSIITAGETYNPSISQFADNHLELEEICTVEIEHKIIDTIANRYWEKFGSYIDSQIKKHSETGSFTHSEVMYVLSNEKKYSKIMDYELASIFKDAYDANKIFFYNYKYRETNCVALAPSCKRDTMVAEKIISETDIIDNYDIQQCIDDLYAKVLS